MAEDGNVQFCCFSPAFAGNINEQSFAQIWNGPVMHRVRATLARQEFPVECQTPSCPIFRGDRRHFLLDRKDGKSRPEVTGTTDPHAQAREAFAKSRLLVTLEGPPDRQEIRFRWQLRYDGPDRDAVDLFVGVEDPAHQVVFLPELEGVPAPLFTNISLHSGLDLDVDLFRCPRDASHEPGEYEVTAALFRTGTSPVVASNCLWATTTTLLLEDASPRGAVPRGS